MFDAKVQALVRAIEICTLDASEGVSFRIFTDSEAAMKRIQNDSPGPGQALARRGISVARAGIYSRGATVSIQWIPGHRGVTGNELADAYARNEAERTEKLRGISDCREGISRRGKESVSLAFVKSRSRKEANIEWREMIRGLSQVRGRSRYKRRSEGIPKIPELLRKALKAIASQFFQMALGHAMIAPFLKEKFGWVELDLCWWCTKSRQTREHLLKECSTWKEEIRKLWKEVAEATENRLTSLGTESGRARRGGKGFGLGSGFSRGRGGRRPGNTSIGMLLGDDRCVPAVLSFLSSTRVGQVKEGILAERGAP